MSTLMTDLKFDPDAPIVEIVPVDSDDEDLQRAVKKVDDERCSVMEAAKMRRRIELEQLRFRALQVAGKLVPLDPSVGKKFIAALQMRR